MSAIFLAVSVVSVRPIADTHSYMDVGISIDEVVTTYKDKKNWHPLRFCIHLQVFTLKVSQNKSKRVETGNVFGLVVWSVYCWVGGECNNQPSTGAAKAIELGKRATGQWLAMVSKRGRRPGDESVDDRTMAGADKFGRRTTQ